MAAELPYVRPGNGYNFIPVQPGDTLWGLALKHTRTGNWRDMFNDNRDSVKDINNLTPGTTLRIPDHNMKW